MIGHNDARKPPVLVKPGVFPAGTLSAGAGQAGMHVGLVQKTHEALRSLFCLSYPVLRLFSRGIPKKARIAQAGGRFRSRPSPVYTLFHYSFFIIHY
jgi:hypothetical protein